MIFLLLLMCINYAFAYTNPDEIKSLPGLKFPINFRQYSGYLNATNGKFLHYWFVESQREPSSDPLVLWMNGGPGCSSLDGFLSELGPFHIEKDGKTLYNNPYSWNKVANVIFLEAPAGVGFSYSKSEDYHTDDDVVSQDNYIALQHFFQKFPQFKKNDFYITGESYGGIYIPTLSVRVLNGQFPINFKGFAIGNGYLDVTNLTNSIVFFGYYHGLLGVELWSQLSKFCCNGIATPQHCNFYNNANAQCNDALQKVNKIIQFSGLNVYNLYEKCYPSAFDGNPRDGVDKRNLFRLFPKPSKSFFENNGGSGVPCTDSLNITNYLNQKSVRAALHIPSFVQDWSLCSLAVEIGYNRIYSTMRPQMLELIGSKKLRGLIYNGDVDMACNFLGDEWFANNLGLKVLKPYGEWHFDNQVAGFYIDYDRLTYLTVKGSGHMVPQDKPGPAFKMISSFLANEPF